MKDSRIAGRYAKALFELAIEHNVLEQVNEDMILIFQICNNNRELKNVLDSPIIKFEKKINIFNEIFGNKINKISKNFINLIIKKRRDNNILQITKQFNNIYNDYKGIEVAYVTSAFELDKEQKNNIINLLAQHTNKQIKLVEKIDKSIIGGFIINYSNKIYDASILTKINTYKREFTIKH
jgi:F-type H+-transporting ATPase subunit delta